MVVAVARDVQDVLAGEAPAGDLRLAEAGRDDLASRRFHAGQGVRPRAGDDPERHGPGGFQAQAPGAASPPVSAGASSGAASVAGAVSVVAGAGCAVVVGAGAGAGAVSVVVVVVAGAGSAGVVVVSVDGGSAAGASAWSSWSGRFGRCRWR